MKSKLGVNSMLAAIHTIAPFSQTHITDHSDKKRKNFFVSQNHRQPSSAHAWVTRNAGEKKTRGFHARRDTVAFLFGTGPIY